MGKVMDALGRRYEGSKARQIVLGLIQAKQ
jgi:hypothetical protein